MKRPWLIALVFGLCLAVVLMVLGWTSVTLLRFDRAAALAQREADREEDVRLALWRMDTMLAAILAQENAQPFAAYSQANRLATSSHVLLHVQFDPQGTLTSPEVPPPTKLMPQLPDASTVVHSERLGKATAMLNRNLLLTMLPAEESLAFRSPSAPAAEVSIPSLEPSLAPPRRIVKAEPQTSLYQQAPNLNDQARQQERSAKEYAVRAQTLNAGNNYDPYPSSPQAAQPLSIQPSSSDVQVGMMHPLWMGDNLWLVRRVVADEQTYVQGCWLDWPELRTSLLASVDDLLPQAMLQPITTAQSFLPWAPAPLLEGGSREASSAWSLSASPPSADPGRMLATLPVMLLPGPLSAVGEVAPSPIGLSLVVAWACALLAGVAVAILLAGVVMLSERRGAFVSAVTHELRTPLTTFRMYAEMLAEGMVPEAERRHYLDTLRGEAERLTRLVENVLAYARLERGRHTNRVQSIALDDLLTPAIPHLRQRVEQDGLQFAVEIDPAAKPIAAQADASAVEQILANLVDNACKYGATPGGTVTLQAGRDDGALYLRVRDDGPGLSRAVARRLFRPFTKSAQEAANSAPGIGLGLALSRRLARDMGGELRYEDAGPGASFVLTLSIV